MPSDPVICQRRAGFIRIDDSSVRNQAQLDQRLEPVADTAHQAVPLLQQPGNLLPDCLVAEEGCNEFAAAIRLIAAGKAAGNKYDLRLAQLTCKGLDAAVNSVRRPVIDYQNLRLRSGIRYRLRTVIFTVGSGEGRNQHLRPAVFHSRSRPLGYFIGKSLHRARRCRRIAAIYAFQLIFICLQQFFQRQAFLSPGNNRLGRNRADDGLRTNARLCLQYKGAILIAEKRRYLYVRPIGYPEVVAQGHFHDSLGHAAHAGRVTGDGLTAAQQLGHLIPQRFQRLRNRQAILIPLRRQQNNFVAGLL